MADKEIDIKVKIEAVEAAKTVGDLKQGIKELQAAYDKADFGSESFKQAGKALDEATTKLSKNQKGLTDLGEAYGMAAKKLPLLTEAQEALNLVMEANPIGIVVAALFALYEIVEKNAKVAAELEAAFAGVKKAFQVIIDDIAGPLLKAFQDPKQALVDLVDFIKQNLINRFKALGVIMKAIGDRDVKGFTNGILQLETGVENLTDKVGAYANKLKGAAKEGYDAAKAAEELTEKNAELRAEIAKNTNEIDKQKTVLMDKSKGDKERESAARKIITLEDENSKKRVQMASSELEAEKLKTKGLQLSASQKAHLIDLQTKIDEEQGKLEDAKRKATIRLNILLGKEEKKRTADLKKEAKDRKKILEDELKHIKLVYKQRTEEFEGSESDRLKIEQQGVEEEMAVVNKGYAEGTIDAKEYDTKARELLIERDKLTKEITKTAIEEDKKAAEEKKKLQERESKATYDLTEAKIQAQKDEIDGDEFAVKERQKIAQEEYDAKLKRLEDEKAATLENTDLTETEKAAKLAEYNNQEIEAHQKMEDAKLDATKSALDQAASSYQQYAGAIQSITDGIFDNEAKGQKKNLAERNKILKKKFIADKAMGIVNAGISTAQSVMQALASTPPPAGYVMAALNGAMGIAQIAAIAAKQFNPETGSGSGAGASSIGGLQSAASMNQPQLQGSSLFNIGKTQMNINTPPPQKVYVTEGDISSTQNKVSVIQGRSLIH